MVAEKVSDGAEETPAPLVPAISPALRRRLQQCFDHAAKQMLQEKYDHDYAHTLLTDCIQQDPGNLLYVERFLENLQRKYDNNKRGARFTGFGVRSAFKKALAKKDWLELLREAPALLKINPWDVPTLRSVAEACAALDLREVELRYLRQALDANPKDAEVNRHCARSLQRMGQFDQAIVCWHRVEEALPKDTEAPKMIAELQIEKTRARAGFGDGGAAARARAAAAGPARTSAASPPAQAALAQSPVASASDDQGAARGAAAEEGAERREIHLTQRQKLERALTEDATDLDNYLRLAQLHWDEQRLADAEAVLKRALAASGQNLKIREKYEDVLILRHRQQLAVADRLAATEKTREAQDLAAQLRSELNRIELDVYRGRCERYPRETAYRYQFALRLKRAGSHAEAIVQLLELVPGSPQAGPAALELGECYQLLKQYAQALKWYRDSARWVGEGEFPEVRKLALYRGGVLATALQELPTAAEMLRQLVDLDPGYKDAAHRLDKIKPMVDKDGPQ